MMLRFPILLSIIVQMAGCNVFFSNAPEPFPPLAPSLRSWQPAAEPRAVVVALHSFGDHGGAYALLGPYFSRHGVLLVSYDQAGFGQRQRAGHWAGETVLINEASQLVKQLDQRYSQPVFLLGESLGGAVAMLTALQQPERVSGIILAAPAVREGIRFRHGWNLAIASAATLAPGYLLHVERRADDPSLVGEHARRLAEDPSVMRQVRMDSYWGLIQLADSASDQAAALQVPSLLLYGGKDNSVPAEGIAHLRQHLQGQNDYHHYPQAPHLLLQSPQWQAISDTILDWIILHTREPSTDAAGD